MEYLIEKYLGEGIDLDEAKLKKVIRGGKIQKKLDCPSGYKIEGKRCVRMSAQEKREKSKSAIRAARKRRSQKSQMARKRQRSLKKHTWK